MNLRYSEANILSDAPGLWGDSPPPDAVRCTSVYLKPSADTPNRCYGARSPWVQK